MVKKINVKIMHRAVRYPIPEYSHDAKEVYDIDADPEPEITEKVATDLINKYTPVQLKID